MFFVFEGEHLTNIKRFDIEYSNLIIFAEEAKSSGALMNIKWFDIGYSNLMIFALPAKFLFSKRAFAKYQTNFKWFDIGY